MIDLLRKNLDFFTHFTPNRLIPEIDLDDFPVGKKVFPNLL